MTVDSDIARERYLSIQRLARDLGRPTDELLTLYVMEGFIARAAESVYSEQLVLKGGMLISAFTERRPTRDIDLQALRIPNDTESLNEVAVQIALIDHEDGIDFNTKSTTATVIRDQEEYSGIRVAMDASVYSANLRLKIDFSIGDPIFTRIDDYLDRICDAGVTPDHDPQLSDHDGSGREDRDRRVTWDREHAMARLCRHPCHRPVERH